MSSSPYRPIALFDSGVGGLSILQSMTSALPKYDFVYLADNKHVPYGDRSDKEIVSYTKSAVEYLFSIGAPLVILACNTATAVALRALQHSLIKPHDTRRILGIIRPVVEELKGKKAGNVGILATAATVHSGSFKREMDNINYRPNITQISCPDLVPLIEQGILDGELIQNALDPYLKPLTGASVDTILLGCTHYNFIEGAIQKAVGDTVSIVSEAPSSTERLIDYLDRHPEVEKHITRSSSRKYLMTQDDPHYQSLIQKLIRQPVSIEIIQVY